jgi:hypothetical protein
VRFAVPVSTAELLNFQNDNGEVLQWENLMLTNYLWVGVTIAALTTFLPTMSAAAAPATTKAATTGRATSKPSSTFEDRLSAEIERAWKDVLPSDMRDGDSKQELTDEQKFLARQARIIMISAEATPARLAEAEKNRAHDPDRIAALEKSHASIRTTMAGQPEEIVVEREKALSAAIDEFRSAQVMLDSPVTAGASQEQVELRAAEKIRDLPSLLRKVTIAGLTAKHHMARANLLEAIADLEKQVQIPHQ